MSKSFLPTIRYDIIGIEADGTENKLFRWTRDPEAGIESAKRQSKEFGFTHLVEFRAVKVEG